MAITPQVIVQTPCPSQLTCVCAGQTVVNGSLEIPSEKPDIEQVMNFDVSSEVTEWKVIQTPLGPKVIAGGMVHVGVQYVADLPSQSVHVAHWDLPWHTFFLCEGGTGTYGICSVTSCVEVGEFTVLDSRHVKKLVILAVCATACPPPTACPPCP